MNRFRLLAIATFLMLALTTVAQQVTTGSAAPAKGSSAGNHAIVPAAEVQLNFFTAKLDLTADQQQKMKPILHELHDATMKLVHDQGMSREDYNSKLRDSRYTADQKIRAILNDEQKKKLDQVEQEPHPELHGNVTDSKD